jgi:hypothetical protein
VCRGELGAREKPPFWVGFDLQADLTAPSAYATIDFVITPCRVHSSRLGCLPSRKVVGLTIASSQMDRGSRSYQSRLSRVWGRMPRPRQRDLLAGRVIPYSGECALGTGQRTSAV